MMLIAGLILAALALIFCEVLLPGGILGLLAAICIVVVTAITAAEYGFFAASSVFIGVMFAALILTIIEFKMFANTRYGRRFFLKKAVDGHANLKKADESIIGKTGKAVTRLNPSGKIDVEGRNYEAFSQDGYVESGESVTVISQDSFKLIIQKQ